MAVLEENCLEFRLVTSPAFPRGMLPVCTDLVIDAMAENLEFLCPFSFQLNEIANSEVYHLFSHG